MDKIVLTLKKDTVQGIINMIENHINDLLYDKLEKYRGHPVEKRINNNIEKWKNRLNELEAFMPKDNLTCESEAKE